MLMCKADDVLHNMKRTLSEAEMNFNEFINKDFIRPKENVSIQRHEIISHEVLQELSETPVRIQGVS